MNRKTMNSALFALTMAISLALTGLPGYVQAQEVLEENFHLGEIKCWDLTGVAEEQRAPTMLMVFGYVAGIRNQPIQKGSEIGKTLERAGKLCVSNPDMYVASAIERAIKD